MQNISLLLDKLLIYDPHKSKSTANVFISRVSPAEEAGLGKLIIITEIKSKDPINQEIINEIQDTINNSYYQTEDLNIETAFESTLEKANQKIVDLIEGYKSNWLDKFSVLVALIKNNVIHFTQVGQMYAFLVHYQTITDIIAKTPGVETKINPVKVFSNVLSGNISEEDALLFCTPSLLDYISQEKIKRLIIERNPSEVVKNIENLLIENGGFTSFAAVIVKLITERELTKETTTLPASSKISRPEYSLPQSSMENLIEKQRATSELLSPSLTKNFMSFLHKTLERIKSFIKLKVLRQSPRRIYLSQRLKDYGVTYKEKQTSEGKNIIIKIFLGIYYLLKKIIILIIPGIASLINLFRKTDLSRVKIKQAPTNFSKFILNIIIRFKKLSRISQILFVVSLIVLAVFTQSLINQAVKKHSKELETDFSQTVTLISEKIMSAEAALSYGDENGAKNLLAEAQASLDKISKYKEKDEAKTNELQNNINNLKLKAQNIINIENPELLADFKNLDQQIDIGRIYLIENLLYSFNPADNTIYQLNSETKELTSFPKIESENKFQYITSHDENTLIFFNTANKFVEYKIDKKTSRQLEFSLVTEDANIVDIATYQSRIYLLDIKNNQIYKSLRGANGYGTPQNWIKGNINLSNVKSFAIDGSIYILFSDGQVYKMTTGDKEDWQLSTIEPALSSAIKIWTSPDAQNIYILDSKNKRMAVFNKSGKLVKQYASEKFNNLKDFTINEKLKKAYLLNNQQVFGIDL